MSRIAKNPIKFTNDVECTYKDGIFSAKGKLGQIQVPVNSNFNIDINEGEVKVLPINESKNDPNWGTTRAIIANTIIGVTNGFTKTLELNGTGYRASVSGTKLKLELGYSHDIKLAIPDDLEVKCSKPTEILVSGIDKQRVGQFASEIRKLRKPEPYKGKGIKYQEEFIRRKEGKKK